MIVGLGALSCAFGGWALWPSSSARTRPTLRVVLVDASDSVRRPRPDWERWLESTLATEAAAAQGSGRELAVLAYGDDVVRWFGPASADEFAFDSRWSVPGSLRGTATNLAGALSAAGAMAQAEGAALEVRAHGDGTFTDVDPSATLAHLQALGARVEFLELPEPRSFDDALISLRAPREVEVGAPLALALEFAAREGELTGEIRVEGREGTRLTPFRLAARQGSGLVDLGAMPEGRIDVTVTLTTPDDPLPENDLLRTSVRSRGAIGVAVAASPRLQECAIGFAEAWNREPGMWARVVESLEDARAFRGIDVLVTLDVDPREVPLALVRPLLESGGGWLACGGTALVEGLSARDPEEAAALLPLRVSDDDEERDLLLVVDMSGSMSGPRFDAVRNGAVELVTSARDADDVYLRMFTDRLWPAIHLGRGGGGRRARESTARSLLNLRAPGGPTDLVRALEELVDEREASARPALLLLLTDGRDESRRGGAFERARIAVERLCAARTRLVTFVHGEDPDWEFLRALEAPELGAEVRPVEEALGGLFDAELARDRMLTGPRALRPSSAATGEFASLAAALPLAAFELVGCVAMERRDGDLELASEPEGHPVLAVRMHGLGHAATLATLPEAGWSPGWGSNPALVLPLVRALGRGRSNAPRELEGSLHGPRTLRVGPFPAPVEGELVVPSLSLDGRPLEPRPLALGAFPFGTLWEAQLPEGASVGASSTLRVEAAGRAWTLPIEAGVAEEYRLPRRRVSLPTSSAGASESASGPAREARWPGLGRAALLLGVLALALGGLLGAAERRTGVR